MKKPVSPCRFSHEAERHLSESKKEDDLDEDDDKGSSNEQGKAKIIGNHW